MKKIILTTAVLAALLGSSAFAKGEKAAAKGAATVLTSLTPGVAVVLQPSALRVVKGNLKKSIVSVLPARGYVVSSSAKDGTAIQYKIDNKTVVACVRAKKAKAVVCAAAAKAKKASSIASSIASAVASASAPQSEGY
jgi:hypothetical protein